MLRQQLHILAFMGIALVRLSTAANWDCSSDTGGNINCRVTLNPSNTFWVNMAHGQSCTHDGRYCGQVRAVSNSEWQFDITNNGVSCTDSCKPLPYCNADNECSGTCHKEVC